MSRPPTMSQLLKREGLAKRPRSGRPVGTSSSSKPPTKNKSQAEEEEAEEDEEQAKEARGGKETSHTNKDSSGDSVAVDDEIAALERELEVSSSSGGNSECTSSSESEDSGDGLEDDGSYGAAGHTKKRARKLVSPLDAETIEPLPAHFLPRLGCGVSKSGKSAKKTKRLKLPPPAAGAAPGPSRGLDSAVRELLANYEARSSERVPFYCRVCQFQGDSLEALERHKQEPLHQEATKKERKISTCSLCKKQFTSPPQLKEHLQGKAHLERLQATMSRQGKWVPGRGAGSKSKSYHSGEASDMHSGGNNRGGGSGRRIGGDGRGRGRGFSGRMGRGRGPGRG